MKNVYTMGQAQELNTENNQKSVRFLLAALMLIVSFIILPSVASAHTLSNSSYRDVSGTTIKLSPATDVATESETIAQYSQLPSNVQSKLASENFAIYIQSSSENGGLLMGGTAAGQCLGNSYLVYTQGASKWTEKSNNGYIDVLSDYNDNGEVMFHEVGHFIDYESNGGYGKTYSYYNASSSAQWQELYSRYQGVLAGYSAQSSANLYNTAEAFAESYAIYMCSPSWIAQNCPEIATYIQTVVSTM